MLDERAAPETKAVPSRALFQVWTVLLVGLLLTSLVLGFQAVRGTLNPDLHAMVAFLVAGLAVASHVRLGSGWDFIAVLLLVGTVALGFAVKGSGGAADLHRILALLAVVLSGVLHLRRWRE